MYFENPSCNIATFYIPVAIPTGALGVLVGALIIRRYNGRTVAMINWILTLIATPPLLIFLIRCPTLQLAGVNVPFADGYVYHYI